MGIKAFEKLLLQERICSCDTMLFIYFLEKNPKYYVWVKKIFDLGEQGRIQLITSKITPIEIVSTPHLTTQPDKIHLYLEYFRNAPYLLVKDISWDIVDRSAKLRREMRLRTPDAIQLATAQMSGARIFLTNDRHFNTIGSHRIHILAEMMGS